MELHRLFKLSSTFLVFASNDLNLFAEEVEKAGKTGYMGFDFKFTDFDLINDIPGKYIYSTLQLKDGILVIQYDMTKHILVLIQGIEGIISKVGNATLTDLDQMIAYANNLHYLDEISVSYENPHRELQLDDIYKSFRTHGTDLLHVVQNALDVKIPHGKMLGAGAEGEVYDYGNDKIIKFFLVPNNKKNETLSFIKKLETMRSKYIANIYASGIAVRIGRDIIGNLSSFKEPIWIAYYIADKALPITDKRDHDKVETLRKALLDDVGLDPWDFYDNPDNIMQNVDGDYIYVDFGSCADFFK